VQPALQCNHCELPLGALKETVAGGSDGYPLCVRAYIRCKTFAVAFSLDRLEGNEQEDDRMHLAQRQIRRQR
jgi:hypothetical protein